MRVVRHLTNATLGLTLVWHALSLVKVIRTSDGWPTMALCVLGMLSFVAGVGTHPSTRWKHGSGELSGDDAVLGVPLVVRWAANAIMTYGFLVCMGGYLWAVQVSGRTAVSNSELGPVGVSAFMLAFAAASWLAGVSGEIARRRLGY